MEAGFIAQSATCFLCATTLCNDSMFICLSKMLAVGDSLKPSLLNNREGAPKVTQYRSTPHVSQAAQAESKYRRPSARFVIPSIANEPRPAYRLQVRTYHRATIEIVPGPEHPDPSSGAISPASKRMPSIGVQLQAIGPASMARVT